MFGDTYSWLIEDRSLFHFVVNLHVHHIVCTRSLHAISCGQQCCFCFRDKWHPQSVTCALYRTRCGHIAQLLLVLYHNCHTFVTATGNPQTALTQSHG